MDLKKQKMKRISELLLSNPLLLLKWGYEFPLLTDTEFSFNVKTQSYVGRIRIKTNNKGYSISLDKTHYQALIDDSEKVIEALEKILITKPNELLPFV
jgi:hypothetical protein